MFLEMLASAFITTAIEEAAKEEAKQILTNRLNSIISEIEDPTDYFDVYDEDYEDDDYFEDEEDYEDDWYEE